MVHGLRTNSADRFLRKFVQLTRADNLELEGFGLLAVLFGNANLEPCVDSLLLSLFIRVEDKLCTLK